MCIYILIWVVKTNRYCQFLCCFLTGKAVANPNPHRNKKSKWYISADVWPYDTYPLWFQGMVYMLSPHYTADLYQAALRTHYMFTDDVFMGICVNKTAAPTQKSIPLKKFSSFRYGKTKNKEYQQDWDEKMVTFFHFPENKLYMEFFYSDINELIKSGKIHTPLH